MSDCDPQHAIEEYFEKHQDFPLKLKECLNKAKTFDIYYKTCSSSSSALFRNTTALKSNTFSLWIWHFFLVWILKIWFKLFKKVLDLIKLTLEEKHKRSDKRLLFEWHEEAKSLDLISTDCTNYNTNSSSSSSSDSCVEVFFSNARSDSNRTWLLSMEQNESKCEF